jgi:tight adherence protein B
MDKEQILNLVKGAAAFGLVLSIWSIATLFLLARRSRKAVELEKRLRLTDPNRGQNGRVLRLWQDGEAATTTVPDLRPSLGIYGQLDKMRQDAGWQMSMSNTMIRLGGAALVAGIGGYLATGTPLMIGAGPIAVGVVFWIYLQNRISKRTALFERQFIDALELAARSLRVGHPLVGSFRLISEEIPEPVGELFGRVCQQQSLGVAMDVALRDVAAQSPSDDLRLFATSVVIQLRSGGNLADLMGRLSGVIRERNRLARRVKVLTAQTQMSKRVLLALPVLAFFGLAMMNPDYMRPLYTTRPGEIVMAAAILGMFFGWVLMNWMGKVAM